MKKTYLIIRVLDNEGTTKTITAVLLTDNLTGWGYCAASEETRIYCKNSNPFSFYRLHLSESAFLSLVRNPNQPEKRVNKEGSVFCYNTEVL